MSDQAAIQPRTMRDSLLDRSAPTPATVKADVATAATATMVRTADALHRLERLAEAMEKAAAEGERQLAVIRGRL
jgi:hypothetical protein